MDNTGFRITTKVSEQDDVTLTSPQSGEVLKYNGSKWVNSTDSTADISGKADKVSGATANNFAGLASGGNLIDSGHKHSDYALSTDLSTHIAATSVHSATSANTASRIVARDASGDFAARNITGTNFTVSTVYANTFAAYSGANASLTMNVNGFQLAYTGTDQDQIGDYFNFTYGGNNVFKLTYNGILTCANMSSANTVNYLVKRDASGNFSAGTITATLSGSATSATTATTATNCTRTLTATAPITIDGSTSADLTANRTIAISAASGSAAGSMSAAHYTLVNNATDANTASTIVKRDASGNFSAGTITATFSGSGASVTSISASNISSGSLADARLSSNIPLKNAANVFTSTIKATTITAQGNDQPFIVRNAGDTATLLYLQRYTDNNNELILSGKSFCQMSGSTGLFCNAAGMTLIFGNTDSVIGFYGAAGSTKPTVSGSRGGNTALASLLTALASQGLLTDSSTA